VQRGDGHREASERLHTFAKDFDRIGKLLAERDLDFLVSFSRNRLQS